MPSQPCRPHSARSFGWNDRDPWPIGSNARRRLGVRYRVGLGMEDRVIELGPNSYGKSQIRLVKVVRGAGSHTLRDLTVAVALEGDFEAAHVTGDNANVVATDTMKNTTYALAKDALTGSIEAFGRTLAAHFFDF